jgi:NHL repeat
MSKKLSNCLRGIAAIGLGLSGLIMIGGFAQAAVGDVSTFAGSGVPGSADGQGVAATLKFPTGVASDSFGNLYVAEQSNNAIRKITPGGLVSTFAGSGVVGKADGQGLAATFSAPNKTAVDSANNVYVTDTNNFLIRKITPSGLVSTFAGSGVAGTADGLGAAASFLGGFGGITVDASGNVYVTDSPDVGGSFVRKISPAGLVSTLAGSATTGYADLLGAAARFDGAQEIVVDSSNNLYVADFQNHVVRKVTPAGLVSTFAGSGVQQHVNGTGTGASFSQLQGLAIDSANNIYVGDRFNYVIRKVTPAGVVTDFAGKLFNNGMVDGPLGVAKFEDLVGLGIDPTGNLFVADSGNNMIRKVELVASAVPCNSALAPCPSSTTATTLGDCVTGATVCPSSTTTTTIAGGCPLSVVCASSTTTTSTTTTTLPCPSTSTTIDAAGVPLCLPAATTTTIPDVTTTTTLPCPSPSTTIDPAGVPRCLPITTTTTTTTLGATTTTRLVPSTSMVFPSIPTPTVPGPSVPPTLLTFGAVPAVAPIQPAPTLTVAALIQQSSIPVAPVPGPSVEGQVADITPAYTGSSSISTLVAAMVSLALGTLLLASRSIRATSRKSRLDQQ